MNNRKKALIVIFIAAMSLAACGVGLDKGVASDEMAVPEVSSEDLLVSSLEYLLLDDEKDVQDNRNTAEESEDISDGQPAQTEDGEEGEEAVVYYGDSGSVALKQETIEVEALTPDELISTLARHNIVSLDTKILSLEQKEEDGAEILYLDLSKAAGEYLRTMSREAECIIVAAVVNTFLENYDADAIYILVEGEALATSNAAYTEPLARCTPMELMETLLSDDSENNRTGVMNDASDEVSC